MTTDEWEYRPYQLECIDRAVDRGNLLVAMTMGSGKTAASIGTVVELRLQGLVRSGLVFALNSTKYQWLEEIKKVDPTARAIVINGTKAERVTQLRHSRRYHYVILHYECLVNDWDEIKKYAPLDFIVADEATYVKSFTAKRSRRLKALSKRCEFRFALSGQPVENRPEELFSIMEFVDPEVLGDFAKFDRTFIRRDGFGRPKKYVNLPTLHQMIQPAMYRKSREDIRQWLPEMIETEMPVPLDAQTMALHNHIRLDLIAAIDRAVADGGSGQFDVIAHYGRGDNTDNARLKGEVMARLLAMRMLASHPQLLLHSADEFDDPASKAGSAYASKLRLSGVLKNVPQRSAKLDALMELIVSILDEDPLHKVVVFSYFKPMLKIIEAELDKLHIQYVKITGDVDTRSRHQRISEFNKSFRTRVFLSSDAGAYGVNLNRGSHLICYDLPWSAGVLQQRISRIDRTSSSFDTIVITYLFGQNTIEERMLRQLKDKLAVAGAFLDGKFDLQTGSLPLDFESLKDFLLAA